MLVGSTINGFDLHPDNRRAVTSGLDANVRLWDIDTGEQIWVVVGGQTTGWPRGALCSTFSGDGRFIAVGGSDGVVRILHTETGETLPAIEGHSQHVIDLATSPDGRILASVGLDATLRLWDAETGVARGASGA